MRAIASLFTSVLVFALLAVFPDVAEAQRVRDLARVRGIESKHLTGIGLVVGLTGTGDSNRNGVLKKYYEMVLKNMGTGIVPEASDINTQNNAIVMVNATLPSTMKPGTEFEVTVSSIGDAQSLRDGYLLAVSLKLPYAYEPGEGVEYAQAHGAIFSEAAETAGLTKAKTYAVLRKSLDAKPFLSNLEDLTLLLDKPDFGSVSRITERINEYDLFRDPTSDTAAGFARAVDSGTIRVRIPTPYIRQDKIIDFISQVLDIEVADVEREAMVAVDRQKGSVIVNGTVRVALPAFIQYKDSMIWIPDLSADADGVRQNEGFDSSPRLIDVIEALDKNQFTGADIIHILKQLDLVGAIKGKFVER